MLSAVRLYYDGLLTEEILLGSTGVNLDVTAKGKISSAVHHFVLETEKDI